jgi:uncharacterized membrane protein YidH (DUF202 family)
VALVFFISLGIAAMGVFGLVAPDRFIGFIRSRQTTAALYLATALRLVLGVALLFAASSSKAPDVLQVVGVVIIVAGLATPFLGVERFRKLLARWSTLGSGFIRAWACFLLVLSFLLVYAVVP